MVSKSYLIWRANLWWNSDSCAGLVHNPVHRTPITKSIFALLQYMVIKRHRLWFKIYLYLWMRWLSCPSYSQQEWPPWFQYFTAHPCINIGQTLNTTLHAQTASNMLDIYARPWVYTSVHPCRSQWRTDEAAEWMRSCRVFMLLWEIEQHTMLI